MQELTKQPSAGIQIEQTKVAQEVQAMLIMAKRFPRDVDKARDKILKACQRPFLAEQAMYAFPRGGELVTGPSIRLAEVLAQNWENIVCGTEEISQEKGVSLARSYAWDTETNVIHEKKFYVPHKRHTKKGAVVLTDPRDIYELIANYGARRLRACILASIPGDIADEATEECKKTLANGKDPIENRIKKLIKAFEEFGVGVDQLEKRLGHKLSATIDTELITLGAIYKSIKDGMAKKEEFFSFKEIGHEEAEKLDNKLSKEDDHQKFVDELDEKQL